MKIKTLEEYVLNELDRKDDEILELKEAINERDGQLASALAKLGDAEELLSTAKELVAKHFVLRTRSKYDTDSTVERIETEGVPYLSVAGYELKTPNAGYLKIRDLLLRLGMRVEEGHEPVWKENAWPSR